MAILLRGGKQKRIVAEEWCALSFILEFTSKLRFYAKWNEKVKGFQLGPVAFIVMSYNFDDVANFFKAKGVEEYTKNDKLNVYGQD